VGGVKRADSVSLPTAVPDTLERSNSTLSLMPSKKGSSEGSGGEGGLSPTAREQQATLRREMEETPLELQPWFAGDLAGRTAADRLESLPVGTFLVRRRACGQFALMLKTRERPRGVKAMAIVRVEENANHGYCFSGARTFESVQKLVAFYRDRDLTENFDYPSLRGIPLRNAYKDV